MDTDYLDFIDDDPTPRLNPHRLIYIDGRCVGENIYETTYIGDDDDF